MKTISFSKDQERKIVSNYKNGIGPRIIAKEYNVSYPLIYRVLHAYKVVRTRGAFSKEQEQQIIKDYKKGTSVKAIVLKYANNSSTIHRILNKYKVMRKRKLRKPIFIKLMVMKDEIINLYTKECFTIRELAEQFDTTHATMYYFLKELNVTFRSKASRFFDKQRIGIKYM